MGITERREREREQRKIDIIDAAESVFFAKGWHSATMDAVADAAELSKATLYLYFKNKEELYAAILVRGSEMLHDMFKTAVESKTTGIDQASAIGRAYIEFHELHRNYYDAMMYFDSKSIEPCDDCEYAQKCNEYRGRIMGLVATAVRNGIGDGTIRSELDPEKTAILLWAQSSGVLQVLATAGQKIQETGNTTSEQLLDAFFELVFYQIATHPEQFVTRRSGGEEMESS
jgi:TetR/AcrR family transcriptional regulator